MDEEQDAFDQFRAGLPLPPSALDWWQSWLEDIEELTRQGKRVARVRFVDEPPTDYQRWEMWATRWHVEAGEDIRYLHRSRANELRIPAGDWWLFDDARLVTMNFTGDGQVAGKTLITDPETVSNYRLWWLLAGQYATTADQVAA